MRPASRQDVISDAVRELLGRSGAFRSLPPDRQREVASSTVAVASAMAEAQSALVREVDFPAFVRDLIHGTLEAIVDAPIRQMEAYAELVAAVARSVDRFLEENVSDDDTRAWLGRTVPDLDDGAGEATAALALDAAHRSTAKQRQQLLATMVLMASTAPSTASETTVSSASGRAPEPRPRPSPWCDPAASPAHQPQTPLVSPRRLAPRAP